MRVTALVEKNENNFYAISTQEAYCGCYFGRFGKSVSEAKEDFLESVKESLEIASEEGQKVPRLEDIEIDYQYDIPAFFNEFYWINVSAFAKKPALMSPK